jgi:hypothetical protein
VPGYKLGISRPRTRLHFNARRLVSVFASHPFREACGKSGAPRFMGYLERRSERVGHPTGLTRII